MSVYEPNSRHLREVLIFCFNMKKSANEAHRMLSNTYDEVAISERTCGEWFQRFKNGDFDVEDRHSSGREKVFEDAELEALLDQDSYQNQEELARLLGVTQQAISKRFKVMRMIQKQGNWVPYELKPRDVEWRLFACEQLLERQRRKGFLHRIVTKNGFITITPSTENHGEFPIMLPRRRQTEYSRLQGHALYLMGPAWRSVL
ncbi:Mariner Mos1 transposase [Acromyrmex echinatior]|uniref:Mariner Mos1 transposase n=1 Tax=Acromyrmex echinatior TaxID=103372 RepID=F4WDC1_ACREC|nr:Mariner Mos1 transposase [Acromyrmex echinatior]